MFDLELIRSAQAGDRDAMIRLLREIETPLYRTAYYLINHEQDALDVTQEALIRIYTNISSYREQAQFLTWAQRIVTNLCIDRFRKQRESVHIDDMERVLPSPGSVEEEVMKKNTAKDIEEAISQLPQNFRTVVVLRYIQDFSYGEIAEILNLPLNTVKSHLFRARKLLQNLLRDYEKGGVRG
nr:sigma-70 family RNA polymerase sigma factor [Thermicanus aegyptius]